MKALLAVAILVVAAGVIGYFAAGWGSENAVSLGPPPQQTSTTQTAQSTALPRGRGLEVWFSRDGRLVETLRAHSATQAIGTASIHALLAGPTGRERSTGMRSEIPRGTRLLGLAIAKGVARVDLSSAYESGASSRSLQLRLAQVVYTLTQFPTVSAVRLSVDGTPVAGKPVGRGAYRSLAEAASPLAGTWRLLPRAPIGAQAEASAAWTGRELVVLGKTAGAAYNPRRNSWRTLGPRSLDRYRSTRHARTVPAAPFPGSSAQAGRELIVVSGTRAAAYTRAGGWRRLPPLPESREGANAVWDGTELLVVGGNDAPTHGFAYDPKANSWRTLAPMDSGRAHAAAVWTGTRLLVWGGETGRPGAFVTPPHGLAYDPKADRWSPLPQAPLRGRLDPLAVWTGHAMIIWGGAGFADGAAFTPKHP